MCEVRVRRRQDGEKVRGGTSLLGTVHSSATDSVCFDVALCSSKVLDRLVSALTIAISAEYYAECTINVYR